jgi:predicted membrane protein
VEKNVWKVILDCCLNAKTYSSFALSISFLIYAYLFFFLLAVLRLLSLSSFFFCFETILPSVNMKKGWQKREKRKKERKKSSRETTKAMEI